MSTDVCEWISCKTRKNARSDIFPARVRSCSICCWIYNRISTSNWGGLRRVITDWANTRCKKTCITKAGFGNTACTIWASWPTVARISMSSSVRLVSLFGGIVLGSARESHLLANECATQRDCHRTDRTVSSLSIFFWTRLMKKSC